MTTRIYIGEDQDPAEVLRSLLDLSPDSPRDVVWVPEVRAVDVPEELAQQYQDVAEVVDDDVEAEDVPALRIRLEELGGKVDGRWGADRLKAEIATLENEE